MALYWCYIRLGCWFTESIHVVVVVVVAADWQYKQH